MRLKRTVPSIFLAFTLGAGLTACGQQGSKASLPATNTSDAKLGVRVIAPKAQLDGQLIRATGRLAARDEAQVSAKIGGSISKLLVDVGDKVKAGQALAQLESAQANISVEQAQAAVAMAQANRDIAALEFERTKKLHASGGIPQAAFDQAEAGSKQAEAALKQANAGLQAARKALADHTLRAPFSGEVTAKLKNVGEYVAMMPPTPVFLLVDAERLEVVLPVPETVIGTVSVGSIVKGIVNPSNQPFEAKVRVVGKVVDPMSRTVEVRADLLGEIRPEMRPHAIVEVDFAEGESISGLFLPSQAIGRDEDNARFVWLVEEGGTVTRRKVEAENLSPGVVRIVSGVGAGDKIVADAASRLADGMQVQVLN